MADCCLCDLKGSFLRVTVCKTCGVPMLVHTDHRAEFTDMEKRLIEVMFPGAKIRWRQRKIHDHAHCHLYFRKEKVGRG